MGVTRNIKFLNSKLLNFSTILLNNFGSVADRDKAAGYVEEHPHFFDSLFKLACDQKAERVHILAAWVLEKYALKQLEVLTPIFDKFLKGTMIQSNESKRRSMVKLLYHYCKPKARRSKLSKKSIDTIIEICFSYMLDSQKAASLSFSMKTLYFFKNHASWIEPEINAYIEKRLPNSSAGFRSVVRQIS